MSKEFCWPQLPPSGPSISHLRALLKLVVAGAREAETRILVRWWASWFGEPMQICSRAQERASMPGLLNTADIPEGSLEISSFDRLFVDLIICITRERSRWQIRSSAGGASAMLAMNLAGVQIAAGGTKILLSKHVRSTHKRGFVLIAQLLLCQAPKFIFPPFGLSGFLPKLIRWSLNFFFGRFGHCISPIGAQSHVQG